MTPSQLAARVSTNAEEIADYWMTILATGTANFLVEFDPEPEDASDEVMDDYHQRRVVVAAATLYAAEILADEFGVTVGIRPTLKGFIVARLEPTE